MSDITTTLTRKQVADGDLDALTLTLVKTDAGVQGDLDSSRNLPNVNSIKFNTAPTGVSTHTEGQLFYDEDWKTLSAHLGRDCTLQIGEEEWRRVYNNTGVIIAEAKTVYTTGAYAGAGTGYPAVSTVALADASNSAKWQALGVTTQEIPINGHGFVTVRGHVNGINTTGFAAGDTLYLCPTTPGCLTNVAPDSPNYKVRMGRCITSAASGRINVRIIANSKLEDLSNVFAPSPAVDDVIKWGGANWINAPGGAISAGPGIDFHCATPSIVAKTADNAFPILTLSKTPVVTAEQTIAGTGDNASTQIPFAAWLYDAALGRTAIDAGKWTFDIYAAISNASGTTTVTRQAYAVLDEAGTVSVTGTAGTTSRTVNASTGTPFATAPTAKITASANPLLASYLRTPKGLYQITARASDTQITIAVPTAYTNETTVAFGVWQLVPGVTTTTADISATGTAYALNSNEVSAAAFTITALHKFGSINFIASTASRVVTTTYNGTTRQASFTTPLVTLHNNLAGLQGDSATELYHLTAAQKAAIGGSLPIGTIIRASQSPGASWLLCDGAALAQAGYPLLYAQLGIKPDFAGYVATTPAGGASVKRIRHGAAGNFLVIQNAPYGPEYSLDSGATWASGKNAAGGGTIPVVFSDAAYSGALDLWVAVGATGELWTSANKGATWTQRTSQFGTTAILSVCWASNMAGGAKFIAAGSAGKISTSALGETWVAETSGVASDFRLIVWSVAGAFALVSGDSVATIKSANGATWAALSAPQELREACYVSSLGMIAAGHNVGQARVKWSTDGNSWPSVVLSQEAQEARRIATDGANVVALLADGAVHIIGTDFVPRPLPFFFATAGGGLAYGNGQWLFSSNSLTCAYRATFSYNTGTSFRVPKVGLDAGIYSDSWILGD